MILQIRLGKSYKIIALNGINCLSVATSKQEHVILIEITAAQQSPGIWPLVCMSKVYNQSKHI